MLYENYKRILYVDLDAEKISIQNREDLMPYLGGVGIASKLLEENMRPELPPLAPEQPIVFAIGPLSTIFPVMTKTVAMFISPLTGELGESYAGGRLAMTMLNAGFDAFVITGRAKRPRYLSVSARGVNFRDARTLWASGNDSDTGRIIRDREPGGGKRSIIRIGPAGENLVSFASVVVDTYRHFGRLGLGACMGSKQLKAISVIGGRTCEIRNFKEYFKVYREIYDKCTNTEMMAKYHDAGTPINIEPLNAAGGLPTLNLQQTRFDGASNVSGEVFAEEHLVRKMACTGCPVGCIHIGQFRRQFADDGYEYEAISVGYDYELIYSLGTFLGIESARHILELIEEVERAGMDAMSTGVALGYATEALSSGLISESDTKTPLAFGNVEGYIIAIRNLASGATDFYKALGKGVRYASSIYGGDEFAMQIAGNEMPGYHTGYGSLVGCAVGARHSHLCNGGYAVDQAKKPLSEEQLVDKLLEEEIERCMVNSLVMCLFARKVYDRETILSAMRSVNLELDNAELSSMAERIYKTKLRIKRALGFELTKIKLPKRYFRTPALDVVLDEEAAYRMIDKYSSKVSAMIDE